MEKDQSEMEKVSQKPTSYMGGWILGGGVYQAGAQTPNSLPSGSVN